MKKLFLFINLFIAFLFLLPYFYKANAQTCDAGIVGAPNLSASCFSCIVSRNSPIFIQSIRDILNINGYQTSTCTDPQLVNRWCESINPIGCQQDQTSAQCCVACGTCFPTSPPLPTPSPSPTQPPLATATPAPPIPTSGPGSIPGTLDWSVCSQPITVTGGSVSVPTLKCLCVAFNNIIVSLFYFAGAVALIFIILGGIKVLTSRGDREKLESGKKTLTYAIIGLILLFLSYLIIGLLEQIIGISLISACSA